MIQIKSDKAELWAVQAAICAVLSGAAFVADKETFGIAGMFLVYLNIIIYQLEKLREANDADSTE